MALVVKLFSDITSSCIQQCGLSSTGWDRLIPVGIAIASPLPDAIQRGVLCLRMMAFTVWGMTQTGILEAVPSILSPEPPTPDSPQDSLVHFALPLPEPMLSGSK